MATCRDCGAEIEFRHINGVLRPIHLSGGFCSGSRPTRTHVGRGWVSDSYLTPNATCPVCGDPVFFYQSPHGGRVFFDDVGWPWPKHGCTDAGYIRTDAKTAATTKGFQVRKLIDRSGSRLKVYYLDDIEDGGNDHILVLRNQLNGHRLSFLCSKAWLVRQQVRLMDFQDAPSFLVHEFEKGVTHIRLDFISARLGKVIRMKLRVNIRT